MPKSKKLIVQQVPIKKYLREICCKMQEKLFCEEYRIKIVYQLDYEGDSISDNKKEVARIDIDTVYLNCTLTLFDQIKILYEDKKYEEICGFICHEFCHILTEPQHCLLIQDAKPSEMLNIEHTRERQTQRICNCLMNLIPEDFYDPKKMFNT